MAQNDSESHQTKPTNYKNGKMSLHWVEKFSITHQLSHFYKHNLSESYKASPILTKWSLIEPKKINPHISHSISLWNPRHPTPNQNPQNKQREKRVLRDENGGRRDCEAWNLGGTEQHQRCSKPKPKPKPKPESCGGRRRGWAWRGRDRWRRRWVQGIFSYDSCDSPSWAFMDFLVR